MYFQARVFVSMVLLAAAFAAFSVEAHADTGDLTYTGCLTGELASGGSGSGACPQITSADVNASGTGFDALRSVAVSPDGRSVYAISTADAAVLHLTPDPQSGQLELAGCISGDRETTGACELVGTAGPGGVHSGLDFPQAVAVSPDGRHVYVAVDGDDAIARFDRSLSTGALTYGGCLSGDTEAARACGQTATAAPEGRNSGLDRLRSIAVSADGRSVYAVAQSDDALVRFDRDQTTGALAFVGCVSGTTEGSACARLSSASSGGSGSSLDFPASVEISPDDRNVYVVSGVDDSIAIFDRSASGGLKVGGCVTSATTVTACAPIPGVVAGGQNTGFDGPRDVAISADGTNLYAITGDDAIVRFARSANGRLAFADCITGESESAPACVRVDGDTPGGADSGLDALRSIAVSADGASVYVASEADDAIGRFDRSADGGALTYAGCISGESETAIAGCSLIAGAQADGLNSGLDGLQDVVVAADGVSAYAGSISDDAVARFERELTPSPAPPAVVPPSDAQPLPPAEGPSFDTRGPALELSGARVQRSRREVTVTASCDERCDVHVAGAAKGIALKAQTTTVEAGGSVELRLRPANQRAKRLAGKAAPKRGRITFRLRAIAFDAAANVATDTLKVTLRRR